MGKVKKNYERIRVVLTEARGRAWQAINTVMVTSYWEIGWIIVEEEQRDKTRAKYSRQIVRGLSTRLSAEFGKGFEQTNK